MRFNLKQDGKRRRAWLGFALLLSLSLASHAQAHGASRPSITPFTSETWARLMHAGSRPAAYVFTTTYCSACPQVFDEIRRSAHAMSPTPPLQLVMMDAQGDLAMRHAHHFQGLTRLYAFDGFEPAIRESVDPSWPNITPYVVLVNRKGEIKRFLGSPPPDVLRWWRQ